MMKPEQLDEVQRALERFDVLSGRVDPDLMRLHAVEFLTEYGATMLAEIRSLRDDLAFRDRRQGATDQALAAMIKGRMRMRERLAAREFECKRRGEEERGAAMYEARLMLTEELGSDATVTKTAEEVGDARKP